MKIMYTQPYNGVSSKYPIYVITRLRTFKLSNINNIQILLIITIINVFQCLNKDVALHL